jgi:hypothetical protein
MDDIYLLVLASLMIILSLVLLFKVSTIQGLAIIFFLLVGSTVILLKYF